MRRSTLVILCLMMLSAPALAAPPADPLRSALWEDMAAKFLSEAPIVFDERVKVVLPVVVENQAQAPVAADARALESVEKLIVFADRNPIQHVLTLHTGHAAPYVAFRMKVEQGTPVRAAALSNGVWHVGGAYLDAMGGGCSAPALARQDADWSETVGQTQGRVWRNAKGGARLRFRVRHPMDTGLARDNTPAFYIERVEVKGGSGEPLASLELFEPVSEDPTLTLSFQLPDHEKDVLLDARDNNGSVFRSTIPAGWKESGVSAGVFKR